MINIAIIGAGIGREHLAALRKLSSKFRVVAVVDQNLERIEEIRDGDTFAAVSDIKKVLTDPEIDVIDICLPPHLHVSVTLDALNLGKHVICEKPLATSLADVDIIVDAAKRNRRHVFPVFQYRWGRSLAQLRHLVRLGLPGEVQTASLETHWSRAANYYAIPWRGTWAGERGGAVLGHAIHNHDLLTHIAGEVAAVSAMTTTRVNEIETEDCAAISFCMTSGALCTSSITLGAAVDETRIRVVFENLTATSGKAPYAPGVPKWEFKARVPEYQPKIDTAISDTPFEATGFQGFFNEVGKAINGVPNCAVTLKEGAASIALVTAIYHAARTGERVMLPLLSDHMLYKGWMP